MTTLDKTITTETTTKQQVPTFNGKYQKLMQSVFDDSQIVFGLDINEAERLANNVATDFAFGLKHSTVECKIGKSPVGKDKLISLSEASKVKVRETMSLKCLRALAYAMEAGKSGFLFNKTTWAVTDDIESYLGQLLVKE